MDGEAGPKGVGADDHQVLIVPIVHEAEEVIVDGEGAMMGEMGRNQRKDCAVGFGRFGSFLDVGYQLTGCKVVNRLL